MRAGKLIEDLFTRSFSAQRSWASEKHALRNIDPSPSIKRLLETDFEAYRSLTVIQIESLKARLSVREQTSNEEIANSVTHGFGVVLSVAALPVLVALASIKGNIWHVVSCTIYGSTLIVLYLSSTLYHCFRSPRAKRIFMLADHSAIFLLIAGTYTPFTLVSMRGPWGWTLFGLIWGFAITGIAMTYFFLGRYRLLFTMLYLGMGWLVIIAFRPLLAAISLEGIFWIVGGGAFYSLGVIFYLWENLKYGHAVWHVLVLAGSVCHFFGILFHVIPVASPFAIKI